jgi:alkylation response protein AidB-like acyl-CoA dehydrogenase
MENLAKISPGVAVAVLVQNSLGMAPLFLFGSEKQKQNYLPSAIKGETLLCLGNSEHKAGSDVANVRMQAENVEGGWVLNGTKAYVTNGAISDLALVTAVSDPEQQSRTPRPPEIAGYPCSWLTYPQRECRGKS